MIPRYKSFLENQHRGRVVYSSPVLHFKNLLMKKRSLLAWIVFACFYSCALPEENLLLETKFLRLEIDATGNVVAMTEALSGINQLYTDKKSPLLSIGYGGEILAPDVARMDPVNKAIILGYGNTGIELTVQYEAKDTHINFELVGPNPDQAIDYVIWGPFLSTLGKAVGETVGVVQGEDFALGIQALNIKTLGGYPTNPDDTEPAYDIFASNSLVDVSDSIKVLYRGQTARKTDFGSKIQAYTRDRGADRVIPVWNHDKYVVPAFDDGGIIGSKIALFGSKPSEVLDLIGTIELEEGLPHPEINGEWAKLSPEATASYLIMSFGVDDMDKALEVTKKAGLRYLYHGDPFETWGHFKLSEKSFPENWQSMKQLVEQAEAEGIHLGVHTLSNFISTNDPYVTPSPDQRLASVGGSILAQSIDATATEIPLESPVFFNQMENNNLHTILLGGELIRYEKVSSEAPWKLLNCERGAFGTSAAAHSEGDTLSKLMDHGYRVFLSDVDLSAEIATTIAEFCNATGIRQISFDGLEGNWANGMGQYSRQLFVQTWYDHLKPELKGEIINDASNPGHFFWHISTRMNWGEPWYAGFRESQTQYRLMNQDYFDRNFMPNMLGWFSLSEETSLMDVEWLLARAAGFDAGFALSTSYKSLESNGHSEQILDKIRIWEKARMSGAFEEEKKDFLKDINKEFVLEEAGDNQWHLSEVYGKVYTLVNKEKQPGEPHYHAIDFANNLREQPLQISITSVGKGNISQLKLELNNFVHIEIPIDLKEGNIFVYERGDSAVLYDKNWNEIRRIELDGSKLYIPMGNQQLRLELEGEANAVGKVELKVLGEKVLITGKREIKK